MTGDEIVLTIPREESFHEVAHLVLGGVAARLNLSFESLDDLETALDAVLERAAEDGELTVKLRLADGAIHALVGPFSADRLRSEFEREPGEGVTLRRILDTVVDGYELDKEGWLELTTYATPNIIGEIKRHFRDRGWSVRVPRGLQELNIQLSRLLEELTVQLGRSPTIPELAKAAEVSEEEVLEALESGRAYSSLSLSAGSSDEEGELDPLESLGTEEHQYEVSEDRAVLAPGFRVLDERERKILHLRFFEGLTQSQIAQQVGISQMHVSRLIRRSLEKIREEIAIDEEEERRAAAGS